MKHLAIATLATFVVLLVTVPAPRSQHSGKPMACTTPLFGIVINGNLVVAESQSCELATVKVTGDVLVETGATLRVLDSVTISRNLEAHKCRDVLINPASTAVSIGGNLTIDECAELSGYDGSGPQASVTIGGNFHCLENSGPCDAIVGSIGGSANISGNSGGASDVEGNKIGGNLLCFGNTAVVGGGNTVAGKKQGQCASL